MADSSPSTRLRDRWQSLLALPLVIALTATTVGVLTLPALASVDAAIGDVRSELLQVPPLPEVGQPAQRSRIFDAAGNEAGVLVGEENRVLVPLDRVPEHLRQAVIATEDRTFYEHHGVNQAAVVRALAENVQSGDIEQGASTITQQYVKNAMLTPAQTLERKIKEAIYATRLERKLSKDEILERYLNIAYFGAGAYGVATAAERFFGVPVEELSLDQAAMLAGMIRLPERNNPLRSPEAAIARRNVVLRQMASEGYITQQQADAAAEVPWNPEGVTEPPEPPFPFFVEYLKKQLLRHPALGETRQERADAIFGGGLRIHTTLDQRLQNLAQNAIDEHLKNPLEDPLGGLLSVDPRNGQIRAMALGPKAFGTCEDHPDECEVTKVNPLVPGMGGSGRQVGSAIKPIVDTAALDSGLPTSWSTNVRDGQPIEGCIDYVDGRKGLWQPENYNPTGGTMDMPEAIRRSNNVFHAKITAEIGPQAVAKMANRLGIRSIPEDYAHCSLALGALDAFPVEMTTAYSTLVNKGVQCQPYAITKVTDAAGNVLIEEEPVCEQVLDPEIAAKMITMMQAVVERGTARAAQIGRPVAGKTGTTNDFKDAWFIGATPQVVTASWVGFELPKQMLGILGQRRVTGGSIPARMWSTFMGPATEPWEIMPLPKVNLDRYTPPPPPPAPEPAAPAEDDSPPPQQQTESEPAPAEEPAEPQPQPEGGGGNGNGDGGGNGNGGGNGDGGGGD